MSLLPNQMYDNELNPVKGWFEKAALDKSAPFAPTEGKVLHNGMVMSLNPARRLVQGLACGAVGVLAFQNEYDFDVVGDPGNTVGKSFKLNSADGTVSGLVVTGGFEVWSTEFDETEEDLFVPNTPITSPEPGEEDAGILKVGTWHEDTVCGIVSDGVFANENGIKCLQFWTYFLPPSEPCPAGSSD